MKKTFEQWMDDVNKILSNRLGLTSDDLPDVCYADYYEDGLSAGQAAREAIQNCE